MYFSRSERLQLLREQRLAMAHGHHESSSGSPQTLLKAHVLSLPEVTYHKGLRYQQPTTKTTITTTLKNNDECDGDEKEIDTDKVNNTKEDVDLTCNGESEQQQRCEYKETLCYNAQTKADDALRLLCDVTQADFETLCD